MKNFFFAENYFENEKFAIFDGFLDNVDNRYEEDFEIQIFNGIYWVCSTPRPGERFFVYLALEIVA